MIEGQVASQWDQEYASGRYHNEPPVQFTHTILQHLSENDRRGYGLYVGCGNGRNYLPLFDVLGVNLRGIDVSEEGIRQIREQRTQAEDSTFIGDFAEYQGSHIFNYLIAIQAFQHGDNNKVSQYFKQAAAALKPGGKLFLRVNSGSTEMIYDHRIVQPAFACGRNSHRHNTSRPRKGTVLYLEGPKKGQQIHFFELDELYHLAALNGFLTIEPPQEVIETREPPHADTTWTQWETVWQKES
jgi:SAM-dependent methyltransferase